MTDRDPSAGAADDAGPRIRRRARSKAGEAEDLRNADAERRAARISVRWLPVESLTPDPENARVHGPRQIARIADSIAAFGFNVPVLIDGKGAVLAGHGRVLAARRLGLSEVPTIALEHLSEPERRAFMIADNRLAELASWDDRRLGVELKALKSLDLDFSIEATGFELDEIELKIDPRIKSGGSRAPGKRPAAASPRLPRLRSRATSGRLGLIASCADMTSAPCPRSTPRSAAGRRSRGTAPACARPASISTRSRGFAASPSCDPRAARPRAPSHARNA